MLNWLRLAWRLQPVVLAFCAVGCLGLASVAMWLATDMRSIIADCGTASATQACDVIYAFQSTHGPAVSMVQAGMGLAQYGVPLVLGVALITPEIEHRTAMISWPMAGSRVRWLRWRALPVLLIGASLIGVMAVAAELLARSYLPHSDIGFANHGLRGVSMLARAGLVFVAAVATGAVIGRLLLALLVGVTLSVGLASGLDAALPHWVASAELAPSDSVLAGAFPLNTGFEYRAPDGGPISDAEVEAMLQAAYEEFGDEANPALLPQDVFFGVAAWRYPEVLIRESAVLGAATLVAGTLGVITLQRRRPA
jgi:hypothetical protein